MNEIFLAVVITLMLLFIIFVICKLGFIQSRLFSLTNRVDIQGMQNYNIIKNAFLSTRRYVDRKLEIYDVEQKVKHEISSNK